MREPLEKRISVLDWRLILTGAEEFCCAFGSLTTVRDHSPAFSNDSQAWRSPQARISECDFGFCTQSNTASAAQVYSLPLWRAQRPSLKRLEAVSQRCWYFRNSRRMAG